MTDSVFLKIAFISLHTDITKFTKLLTSLVNTLQPFVFYILSVNILFVSLTVAYRWGRHVGGL